jgi:hypothetical protein
MLSFSQITPPSYFGRGQRARGRGRLRSAPDWAAADDSRRSGHLPPSAASLMAIQSGLSKLAAGPRLPPGYGIMREARA